MIFLEFISSASMSTLERLAIIDKITVGSIKLNPRTSANFKLANFVRQLTPAKQIVEVTILIKSNLNRSIFSSSMPSLTLFQYAIRKNKAVAMNTIRINKLRRLASVLRCSTN